MLVEEFQSKVQSQPLADIPQAIDALDQAHAGASEEKQIERLYLFDDLAKTAKDLEKQYMSSIVEFDVPGEEQRGITELIYKAALIAQFQVSLCEPGSAEHPMMPY